MAPFVRSVRRLRIAAISLPAYVQVMVAMAVFCGLVWSNTVTEYAPAPAGRPETEIELPEVVTIAAGADCGVRMAL